MNTRNRTSAAPIVRRGRFRRAVIAPAARLTALTLMAALVPALTASAQPVWVPLQVGAPPGTPADIVYDAFASTANDTFLDIFISGFWTEDVAPGDGNVYQRISVPGLGHFGKTGAPDLPAARLRLAVSTGAANVVLASATDLDPRFFTGQLPYPWTIQELDEDIDPLGDPGPGDPDGTPEVFVRDDEIYLGAAMYPGGNGTFSASVRNMLGSIPGAAPEVYPASWDPLSGRLRISAHMRVHLVAPGVPSVHPPMTIDRGTAAAATFHNWPGQQTWFPINTLTYEGRYLIVTPAAYVATLQPFVTFKSLHGFSVSVITLESLAAVTCGEIRGAIDDWYQAGSPWADHYALLIGDADVLPLCPSPTVGSVLGDDLYGSPADGDLDEEVYVGRLSVDDASDLASQLGKIIGYSKNTFAQHFDEVLLVAHSEGAPGKYEGAHESVAAASYAMPPVFEKLYGSQGVSTNASVRAALDAGVGLVAYRGHGSQTTWYRWNQAQEDFHKNDVLLLQDNIVNPHVAWSFSCWNNDITYDAPGDDDCIGEVWLEREKAGAVAHYGSTDVSGTNQNHELDRRMFEAVYDLGLTRHGQAIAWAEQQMADIEPGINSWMYMLLGDPSMRIRREDPQQLVLDMPFEVPVCSGPNCIIQASVTDALHQPVQGVLVALYKPGAPGNTPDVLVNAYTNDAGIVVFPTGPSDISNAIGGTGSDPCGNQVDGISGVVSGAWANFGPATLGENGLPALLGDGPLDPNTPWTLDLTDAAEDAFALLFLSLDSNPVPFKGGTLWTVPWVGKPIALVTGPQGQIPIAALWPAGIPSDVEFWFQYAIADDASATGASLSNAMRATTP